MFRWLRVGAQVDDLTGSGGCVKRFAKFGLGAAGAILVAQVISVPRTNPP